MAEERVRIELAFERGQAFSALVDTGVADEIERRLKDGAEGTVDVEAEDGRYVSRPARGGVPEAVRPRVAGRLRDDRLEPGLAPGRAGGL